MVSPKLLSQMKAETLVFLRVYYFPQSMVQSIMELMFQAMVT